MNQNKQLSSPETTYARPYADSDDPTLRGHITSGWNESRVFTRYVGDSSVEKIQALRNGSGDVTRAPLEEHLRLQRIMSVLALKYNNLPGATAPDVVIRDNLSAEAQLAENGIIDRVPGGSTREGYRVNQTADSIHVASAQQLSLDIPEIPSPSVQDRMDELLKPLSKADREHLLYVAENTLAKREAQLAGDGLVSERHGQLAGQHARMLSASARAIANQYVALYMQREKPVNK